MSWDVLNEDDNDIFSGTPKSRFWNIANQASDDVVKEVFDELLKKYSMMERLLEDKFSDDEIENFFNTYSIQNLDELDSRVKSNYIYWTTEIVNRLDS